jgi:hypothetical protein
VKANTASIIRVATATVPSASSIKRRNGASTTWTSNCLDRMLS